MRTCSLPLLGIVALAACGGSISTTLTGPKQPPRAADCEFEIFTIAPAERFTEIAVIDVELSNWGSITEIAEFKDAIRPHVCDAGGDAAVAVANGHGMYLKATVLKTASVQSTAPAPQTADADETGCKYDAQCKGERICVQGACVDPASTAPAAAGPPTPP